MIPRYPAATRLDVVEYPHGHPVADPYRWLEHPREPATVAWSAAQDELFQAHRTTWEGRDRLTKRVIELQEAGAVWAPVWRGTRPFFQRRSADQQHPVVLTVDADGRERVLLDPTVLDPSGRTTLDRWQPSREGALLAYQLSVGGTEESAFSVLDVGTGAVVDGPVTGVRYSPVAWLPGGRELYYVRRPPGVAERRIWLHRLGTSPDEDVPVYGEGLPATNYYGVEVSRDGRWLTVSVTPGAAPRNDVWIADLAASSADAPDLRPVVCGANARTDVEVGQDGRLYLRTNDSAPRGRLCVAPVDGPAQGNWRTLVAEDRDAVLVGFVLLDPPADEGRVLCAWTRHGVSRVTCHRRSTGELLGEVPLTGVGTVNAITVRPEGGTEAWLEYTDFVTPPSVHRYDAGTGVLAVWAGAPGQVTMPAIDARQVTYASTDGTAVRMFVLGPVGSGRSAEHRPSRPALLTGYGGFGSSLTPAYAGPVLAWVEAGGVYAVACVRGGGEEGDRWHQAGMGAGKRRAIEDFHAAAARLVADGWTTPDRLAILGGSNGGLVVGAAMVERPELYAAAVCVAPLLDMVRYQRSGLGATWTDEYGDAADPDQFAWLLSYSPYHHVDEGVDYPAALFAVFDADTRVDPWHARKMCAALQYAVGRPPAARGPARRPILLRREADVGHGRRSASRMVDMSVDLLAFVAHQTGLAW
jgi:prolyl oligopeptidase